ncbi:unnamed protein product [Cylicocyclus nassatus]|uniref:Amino acid permease/ SLC12A domain-containing protein n=1 Tax=Cylicocyclus nassatus TaxID=53992 RepID=A0AA36H3X1_CYLNA|nr:unnamed protein product [Cylicocyclus nassatus]
MAYAIVMLTVLSLCAISSNGAVEGGGVYYMISRSLGPEFGGAIGVLFFVANVFSCALYISGFTEALLNNLGNGQFPDSPMRRFLYCVLVSVALLILSLLGAGIFAKTALVTFILISICYSTWIISVIVDRPMQVPIPKVNTPAYRVHENASDPNSPMTVMLNQTLTANYYRI